MNPRARDYAITFALTALACSLRLYVASHLRLMPAWDGVLYDRGAQAIARGLGYTTFMFEHRTSDTVPTAYYPVGYPAALGLAYALFGVSRAVQWTFGALVSGLSVGVVHRVGLRVTDRWMAHGVALFVALMPGQILFAGATMTEPLWGLLLIAAVHLATRSPTRASWGLLVALGVVLAAATYVRPQAVLLAPLLPWVRKGVWLDGWRGRALSAVVVSIVCVACVAPWSVRNCTRLDGCAFVSTNGGSNLAIGALPRATGGFYVLSAEDGCRGVVGEVARDRCWRGTAWSGIRYDPWRWMRLGVIKLEKTLAYESFPAGYMRESERETGVRALPAWWVPDVSSDLLERNVRRRWLTPPWMVLLCVSALAVIACWQRRAVPAPVTAALLALGTVLATHALFFGGDRYHLPLVPLFAVVACSVVRGREDRVAATAANR